MWPRRKLADQGPWLELLVLELVILRSLLLAASQNLHWLRISLICPAGQAR